MAQLIRTTQNQDDIVEKLQSPLSSPTIGQLLNEDNEVYWPESPTCNIRSPFGDHASHNKKFLVRVREKAKRWRHTVLAKNLSPKKTTATTPCSMNSSETRGQCKPSSWGAYMDQKNDEQKSDKDPDSDYLGCPMYESETAPEECKESARQHPREIIMAREEVVDEDKEVLSMKTMKEKLVPAYETMAEVTHAIAELGIGAAAEMESKGVSVKEYVMHKLEPGDDERALCEVITEVMSPRKGSGEYGVVYKLKEAVTSFISSSHIPISTNAHQDGEEDTERRVLQTI